ncbi:MAG: glycosyltransferase [Bacteroidota bacterium]
MFLKNINKFSKEKAVLVIPLDWGLGHATRCIPLIQHLQSRGFKIIVGAEGKVKSLLQHEFQQLTFLELPGYRVHYSKNQQLLPLTLLLQVPKILATIYREHQWLKKAARQFDIQAIFSDNRFGLFHSSIPTVFITHQLAIKTGNSFTERMARNINYKFIRKFSHCWVPDFEGTINMAGELSHPQILPPNLQYIGGLSRFTKEEIPVKSGLLILLSGPEPQRTIFEQILLKQIGCYNGQIIFVRGLPGDFEELSPMTSNPQLKIVNHMAADKLAEAISGAEWVISRSGYTTVMDLIKLRQKAILVPTPAQPEQEYLADYLHQQKYFFVAAQHNFRLSSALEEAASFPYNLPAFEMDLYKKKIDQFVDSL